MHLHLHSICVPLLSLTFLLSYTLTQPHSHLPFVHLPMAKDIDDFNKLAAEEKLEVDHYLLERILDKYGATLDSLGI